MPVRHRRRRTEEQRPVPLAPSDAPAVAGMIAICGEHAHRVYGHDHWYPTSSLDALATRLEQADLFGYFQGLALVGAIAMSPDPLPYYPEGGVFSPAREPVYLHGLVVLPAFQGRGFGRRAMRHVDQLAGERQADVVRFDAATMNERAVGFYRALGYEERGVLPVRHTTVTCFERRL